MDRAAADPSLPVCTSSLPDVLWPKDLPTAAARETAWLWHGYLARGGITLLVGRWKAGKTTLLAALLARLKAGGELAGRAVAAGRAVVVTEEGPEHWLRRSARFDFTDQVCWLCRPFRTKPTAAEWLALLDQLAALHARFGLALVVFDTLASFLPGRDENSAGAMLEALLPLRRLTAAGLGVLLVHHPRKGPSGGGLAARGSGALPGHADVLVEMAYCGRAAEDDRRRRLEAYSRFPETPRRLVVELTADGTDYVALDDVPDEGFTDGWAVLRMVLEDATGKWTRRDVLAHWPDDYPAPADNTLWRWLERAVAQGLACRDGTGRRNDPFRYWLPEQLEKWRQDPLGQLELDRLETLRALDEQIRNPRPPPWLPP